MTATVSQPAIKKTSTEETLSSERGFAFLKDPLFFADSVFVTLLSPKGRQASKQH